jgi:hypothetical protein
MKIFLYYPTVCFLNNLQNTKYKISYTSDYEIIITKHTEIGQTSGTHQTHTVQGTIKRE